ncbi:hypothetical protein BVI2075_20030 [Burkholderia vietnamiensis]|nr:hypothetical protein BVI2075_20030 [Burkholderia vietnamiensis]
MRGRRWRPHPALDAMMLLSSIYPRIGHAAGKVGSDGRHWLPNAACAAPGRFVAGAGLVARAMSLRRTTARNARP